MHSSHTKYKIRAGTIDRGKEYESKILTFLSLRCLSHSREDFWFAFNADDIGSCDDVILHNGKNTFMLQLKHKENSKSIVQNEFLTPQKGDFCLKKYFQDILNLKSTLNSLQTNSRDTNFINHLGSFEDIYFVLYTNRSVNDYNFLIRLDDTRKVSFLNSGDNCEIYKFDWTKFPVNYNANHVNCTNFYLFSNQIHAKDIDVKIEQTIKQLIGTNDAKIIGNNLIKFVAEWGKGNLGGHYCLTRSDIVLKLSELLLNEYEVRLLKEPFCYYNCRQKMLWNRIISDKTITVIDVKHDDKVTFSFLLDYIGSEVRLYCNIDGINWSHSLSQDDQKKFYEENVDFKLHMLKIVGNHGKITMCDIYRCLWNLNKLPLLLEIDKKEQYEHIVNILKLSNFFYKIIVINRGIDSIIIDDTINHWKSLQNLGADQKDAILNIPIKLQGRPGTKLKNILDESIFPSVKTVDMINILLNNFNVGAELNLIPKYYIRRGFIHTLIKVTAIKEIMGEIFLIDDFDNYFQNLAKQEHIKFIFLNDSTLSNLNKCNVIINNVQENEIPEKLFSSKKIIHHLIYRSTDYLQWKESFGSIKNIKNHRAEFGIHLLESNIDFSPHVTIISADPGMGKSVLMDFIAEKAPLDRWIIKIDLNKHHDYYENYKCKCETTNALEHLQYFKESSDNYLDNIILEKLLLNKKVIVLLDGFDEISLSYKQEVTNISKSLINGGFHIWLTTRPLMKSYLELEFNSFAIGLIPFNKNDQEQFLLKYFSDNNKFSLNVENLLNRFIDKLLTAFKKNINDRSPDFTGTPLHIKILAEVFKDEFERYVLNEKIEEFDENFDILDLYDNFIKKKIKIFCNKFGSGSKDLRAIYKNYQSLYALKLLFPFHKNNIEAILNNFYKHQKESIQLLQKEGVLTIDENFNINFVHRTFAEYLAAEWLVENFNNENEDIRDTVKILIGERFTVTHKFMFSIFDRFLTKGFNLHTLIINGQIEKVSEMINENSVDVMNKDKAARSVLHLCALYVVEFPLLINVSKLIISKFDQTSEIPIDIFGYNPVDYALANDSFQMADVICNKWRTCRINIYIDITVQRRYLYHSFINYGNLFNILLSYFAYRDVILRNTNRDEIVSVYLARISSHLDLCKHNMKVSAVLHLENYANTVSLPHEIVFGCRTNVEMLLICNKRINAMDIEGNTPLHYAVLHEKSDIIDLLLAKGADINKENADGITPLYCAVSHCHFTIVNTLLINKANVNACTDDGNTPLHIAVLSRKIKTVSLLINNGADLNIRNKDGDTCFHLLIIKNYDELLMKLLRKGIYNDEKNSKNETPLHLCLNLKKFAIAKLLISNGANVNSENILCESILHTAVKTFDIDITREIFLKGGILNPVDQILIHSAMENGDMKMMKLLLDNGGQINTLNKEGRAVLHYATAQCNIDRITLILNFGADVNVCDKHKNTPLHLAVKQFHGVIVETDLEHHREINMMVLKHRFEINVSIVKLLIANGANINARNTDWKTPIHYLFKNNIDKIISAILNNEIKTAFKLDFTIQDDVGNSAFHYAIQKVDINWVEKILLNYKVELNQQNNIGDTVLHLASKLNLLNTVRLLCEKGADANKKNNTGCTPLHVAVTFGNFLILKEFLEQEHLNINIDETDKHENTLLHLAIKNFPTDDNDVFYKIIIMILKYNANVNMCDTDGNTVLHLAVQKHLVDVIKILFAYQADIDIYNSNKKTAQLLAYEVGNAEIIDLFQNYCVDLYKSNNHRLY